MSSALFQPITIGTKTLSNRIVIAPMCQYSAENGRMTDWHLIHLGHLALSGAGLLTIEATAVEPEGRITYGDVGLWDDATEAAMARVLESIRRHSDMPIAIQLAHAGRKASTDLPWKGGKQIAPGHPDGWQTVAPSPLPFAEGENPPTELRVDDLKRLVSAFADSARRAARLGIDAVQLHGAHGYLLHEFLSPLSNRRNDAWGGDFDGRARFVLEMTRAVRAAIPDAVALCVRVSHTDWVAGGWTTEETVELSRRLRALGVDMVDVSSGGLHPDQKIALGPGYQVPGAQAVRQGAGLPVAAVGMITEPAQAQAILAEGRADLILLARALLRDPYWPLHAAAALGRTRALAVPPQYERGWNTLGAMERDDDLAEAMPAL